MSERNGGRVVSGIVYLNCLRCGLSIASRPDRPQIEHCPRCIARRRIVVRLFASRLPTKELYAAGSAPTSDRASKRPIAKSRFPRFGTTRGLEPK